MADQGAAARGPDGAALDEAVRFASELIRIDTSNRGGGDCAERPAAEYVAERLAEAGIRPQLIEPAPGRANVVARIEGWDRGAAALLVHGHLDVVPAEPADWTVHPFSGAVEDGAVWGRGAIDMKGMDAMVLAVVRGWARQGRRPRRDIVLAFTADEEDSAAFGADHLVRRHAGLFDGCTEAIGESGGFTFHAGAGLRLYPIGAGERGTAWLDLAAKGRAGHGSGAAGNGSPAGGGNAVTRLAAAVARIGEYRWPVRLTPTVTAALTGLAELHGFEVGLAAGTAEQADLAVEVLLDKLGRCADLVAPAVRSSATPTVLAAGGKVNVVPGSATAQVDGRVVPGGAEEFVRTIDRLAGPDVQWSFRHRTEPLQAPVDSEVFAAMRRAVEHFDPGAHAVPYCMAGGTDAKQFARLGITGYGFSPLRLPPGFDLQALYHGVDERVPVDGLHFGVRVLDRFLGTVG